MVRDIQTIAGDLELRRADEIARIVTARGIRHDQAVRQLRDAQALSRSKLSGISHWLK